MVIDFLYKTSKLRASYRVLSKVPSEVKPEWDFGDNKGSSNELNPTYTYEASGFYTVTLKIGEDVSTRVVLVTEFANTHLTDSIYNLINNYIPVELSTNMSLQDKIMYIEKWQLYLHTLVNHTIPTEEYSNELYYEGLENQLVMELAVYDYLYTKVVNMLISTGYSLESIHNTNNQPGSRDRVKQITTGPSEVQFFDDMTEGSSATLKVYSSAIQPGGVIDSLKENICMLASRLDIYLPICRSSKVRVVPKVDNRRDSSILGGPNPGYPVNSGKGSLIPD